MNRCPITYESCGDHKYSEKGLHLLSKTLQNLKDFPFTPKEQIELAMQSASKISIQGIQPKLSVILNIAKEQFEMVEKGGTYIFKPPHHIYEEVPQNEDVTMRLAQMVDIEVPIHGMIYNVDGSFTYFIRRFDRLQGGEKIAVEDFAQLLGLSRDIKYESSMEKLIPVIDQNCTFPVLEKLKFFRLTLFCFLIGNEDMHLKNFSLITRNGKIELSPAYDLLNTTIILKNAQEELALPIRGKKSSLKKADIFDYFGRERLGLNDNVLKQEKDRFEKILPAWESLLRVSFLSEKALSSYLSLMQSRFKRLF
ncbi:MAG: HipA domain-containing protein [Verrucomicrobia bacterium]|nr:HipA domain-containing protein [Verrucomicrobiota bacterium]